MDNNAENLAFQINQSGVLCRGYGSLPTAIMTDRFLPIISKGLLCFFYACCGDGNEIALRKDYILSCTGLGHVGFHSSINQLIEAGLITIKREINRNFSPNTYVLRVDTQRYNAGNNKDYIASADRNNNIIAARDNQLGIFCEGYCVIPRAVMEYSGLSIKSKAVYGYLSCCVANGTASSTPVTMISKHLSVTQNTLLHLVTELKKNGFVTVMQNKSPKGQHGSYGFNKYQLIDKPAIPLLKGA